MRVAFLTKPYFEKGKAQECNRLCLHSCTRPATAYQPPTTRGGQATSQPPVTGSTHAAHPHHAEGPAPGVCLLLPHAASQAEQRGGGDDGGPELQPLRGVFGGVRLDEDTRDVGCAVRQGRGTRGLSLALSPLPLPLPFPSPFPLPPALSLLLSLFLSPSPPRSISKLLRLRSPVALARRWARAIVAACGENGL